MNDSVLTTVTAASFYFEKCFRSAAGSRAGEDFAGEEQGAGDIFETSAVSHWWSKYGDWGKFKQMCTVFNSNLTAYSVFNHDLRQTLPITK